MRYAWPSAGAPVTGAASADARNRITFAIASGLTHRVKSAFGMSSRLRGVSMMPGRIALTVMLRSFNSSASASVKRCTPALDAA